jgi:HTH-type transcriptional regulator/antitoxin HigA
MKTKSHKNAVRDSYLNLSREFPLRPIKDDADYDRATVILDRLAVRGEIDLDPGESDYLDALTVFIEKYDDEHYPIDTSDITGLDALKHLMTNAQLTQAELADLLGVGPNTVSMIVSGKRPITAGHARALGKHFAVEAGLYIS